MSVRAVGWLQSKLGLDIGARSADGDGGGHTDSLPTTELAGFASTDNRSSSVDAIAGTAANGQSEDADHTFTDAASQWEAKLGRVWRQANEKATRFWNTNVRSGGSGGSRNDPFGFGAGGAQGGGGNGGTGDGPELDENGLPVTKNWYYFDANLGRWTVSADAPQSVQREYYEQLEEAEKERTGQRTILAPPPPPPPPPAGMQRPPASMNVGAPPPPPGAKSVPGGLFGGGGAHVGRGPQYALPDYFGNAAPAPQPPYPGAPSHSQQTAPQQANHYVASSAYSGTAASAPIRSSPYPPASLSPPQDFRPPTQAAQSSPPTAATGLPARPSGYATAPYPPAAAAHPLYPSAAAPQPARAPTAVSRGSASPSNSSVHASYAAPSLPPWGAQGSSSPPYDASASPPATNMNMLRPRSHSESQEYPPPPPPPQHCPQQQLYSAYSPPQGSLNTYGSSLPETTDNFSSFVPTAPLTQASYNCSTSAPVNWSSNASLHAQGDPIGSTHGSAPLMPLPTAVATATSSNIASGAPSAMRSSPPPAWQSQASAPQPPQPPPPQQQAPPSLRTALAQSNPFAQRPGTNSVIAAPSTQTLPTPQQPQYATQLAMAPAAPAPAPAAAPTPARLPPPPPSFKPFTPS
ncbi:hypothetical protein ABB37_04334 [Leptomonas pyrrhocoris]|uniref:Uncharacterized protein n=1 Tax=Leptomonas pyrrhocoris TaxID=157538 RepID=A0A0N0DVV9_LEPPY|nr:hypothetical protein ABB37_04334 [Leptomonas pyrrhocoris]KPA80938.1 hypothetical protein ABB37_04334 [Leptomonas pyrrhocoris]|eukprot:XP_015659377.1 hypothetical protein ABB37_04334 [Leptomonas pyrrhocoris]